MEFLPLKHAGQHNCTVSSVDEKGKEKICNGQLKEWMTAPPEIRKQVKAGEAIYRCRRCGAVYAGTADQHLHRGATDAIGLPPQFPVIR